MDQNLPLSQIERESPRKEHVPHHHPLHRYRKSSSVIWAAFIGVTILLAVFFILMSSVSSSRMERPGVATQEQQQPEINQLTTDTSDQQSWVSRLFGVKKTRFAPAPVVPTPMPEQQPLRQTIQAVTATVNDATGTYCKNGYLDMADTTSSNVVATGGQVKALTLDTREGNVTIPHPVFEATSAVDGQTVDLSKPSEPAIYPIARFGAAGGYPFLTAISVYDADTKPDPDNVDPVTGTTAVTYATNQNPYYLSSYIEVTYIDKSTHYYLYPITTSNLGYKEINITDGYVSEIAMKPGVHSPKEGSSERRDSSWFGGICAQPTITVTPTSTKPSVTPTWTPAGPMCNNLVATVGRGSSGIISIIGSGATYGEVRVSIDGGAFTSLPKQALSNGSASFSYTVPAAAKSFTTEARVCTDSTMTTCSAWGSGSPTLCRATQTYTTTPTLSPTNPPKTPTRTPTVTLSPTPPNQAAASCTSISRTPKGGFYDSQKYTCFGKNAAETQLQLFYNGSSTPNATYRDIFDKATQSTYFSGIYFPSTATSVVAKCSLCSDVNNNGHYDTNECTPPGSPSTCMEQIVAPTPPPRGLTCIELKKDPAASTATSYTFLLRANTPVDPAIGLRAYAKVIEDGVERQIDGPGITNGSSMVYEPNQPYGPYYRSVSYTKKPGAAEIRIQTKVCLDDGLGTCINYGEIPACSYSESIPVTPTTKITSTPPPTGCPNKVYFYQDSGSAESQLYSAGASATDISGLASPTSIGGLYKNCDIEAAETGYDNRLYAFMGSGRGTLNNGYKNRNNYDGWVMQIDPDTGELYEYFNTGFSELVAAARENATGNTIIVKSEYCDKDHQNIGCIIRVDLAKKTAQYLFSMDTNIESLALDKSGKFFWATGNKSDTHTASGGRTVYKLYLTPQSNGSYFERSSWTLPGNKDVEAAMTLGQLGTAPDEVVFGLHNQTDKSFVVMDMGQTATNIAVTPVLKQSIGGANGVYDPETIFQVCGTATKPNATKKIDVTSCDSGITTSNRALTTEKAVSITTTYNATSKQVSLTWPALTNITSSYIKRYAVYSTDAPGSDIRVKYITPKVTSTGSSATDTPSDQASTALYAYSLCVRVSGETQDRCSNNTKMVPTSQIAGIAASITLPATSVPAGSIMVQEPKEIAPSRGIWEFIRQLFSF